MVSAVSSSSSVAATGAASAVAKIAELNKQASSLRQDLLRANHIPPSADDIKNAEAIQGEIVNVQQQIEQAVLEMQLSRLNVINATRNEANASGKNSQQGKGDADAAHAATEALHTEGSSGSERQRGADGAQASASGDASSGAAGDADESAHSISSDDASQRVRLAGAYQLDSPDKLVDEQA